MTNAEIVFEAIFNVWTFGAMQDAASIFRRLKEHGVPPEEFCSLVDLHKEHGRLAYMEHRKKATAMRSLWKASVRRCPECSAPMGLAKVNDTKATQVGGDWKCLWACSDHLGCGHEEYSASDIVEEANKYDMGIFFDPKAPVQTVPDIERRRRNALSRRRR